MDAFCIKAVEFSVEQYAQSVVGGGAVDGEMLDFRVSGE